MTVNMVAEQQTTAAGRRPQHPSGESTTLTPNTQVPGFSCCWSGCRHRRGGHRRNRQGERRRHNHGRDLQQFTRADDHGQGEGSGVALRQEPVLIAIKPDHSSFPVVQGVPRITKREDAKIARTGDTRSFGEYRVEQERVDDGRYSVPRTHRGQELFFLSCPSPTL